MLILVLIPMSFAADIDNNATSEELSVSDSSDDLQIDELSTDDSDVLNAGESDVLSASYDYESTVTPDTVSYTKGESLEVTVTIKCDYTYPSAPMYVYINGDTINDRQVVNGVYGNKNSFTYDLNKISDKLVDGTNILKFHIDESYLTNDWLTEFKYNPLTVNVGSGTSEEAYTGIIYVDSVNGNADNNGNETNPVNTLEKALELATSAENLEHKIIVNEGTYALSNYQLSSPVAIVGVGNVYIVPDGKKYHFDLSGSNTYEFENLIFANGGQTGFPACGSIYLRSTSTKLNLKNCTFLNNTGGYYGIVYVNGGQVTAVNCNFINNTVTSSSGAVFELVSTSKATISYSNIINNKNTASGGLSFIKGADSSTVSVENNYWGDNNGPNDNQINLWNYQPDKWIKLEAKLNDSIIYTGNSYELTINFVSNKGSLAENMPNLDVDLSALGTLDKNTVTVSENAASVLYTAGDVGDDTLTIKVDDIAVATLPISVEDIPKVISINFEDAEGINGATISVPVNVTINDYLVGNDDISYSFNGNDDTLSLNSGIGEITIKLPDVPGKYNLTVRYDDVNVTKVINVIYHYTGIIYVASNGNDDNDGSSDSPVATIGKAIELASDNNNKAHKIIISEGTYAEHDLSINSALDIAAEGNVVIDAQQLGRILDINADTNISGITFKNGKSDNGGAISIKDAKVAIDNSLFEDNEASSYGSAIYWDANDGVLTNTKFTNNTGRNGVVSLGVFAWGSGATGSNTLVENCTFDNNHNTAYGNCIGLDVTGNGVTIKNSNFTNNKGESGSEHGALYIKGDNAVVDGCLFENNTMGMAAAIQLDGEDTKVSNSKFINNTVSGYPGRSGAIEIQNSAEITNNIFIGNGGEECNQGGAIDIVYAEYGGEITISNNEFINNTAINGAGVYVDGGSEDGCEFDSVNIGDNVFDGNVAVNGAGIYTATSYNQINIEDNEFKNLNAESGACIYNDGVPVSVSGNTVEDCTSEDGSYIYDEYGDIEGSFPENPVIEISTNNPQFGENATITIKLPSDATSNITVSVDNNVVANTKVQNGALTLNVSDLSIGTHNVTVTYAGDTSYASLTNKTSFTISKVEAKLDDKALDISVPVGDNSPSFTINLPSDATGTLNVTVDGKSYIATVSNGSATVKVPNLSYGSHKVTVTYSGDSKYGGISKDTTVNVPKPVITAKNVVKLYTGSAKYQVRVTVNGKAVSNQYVTFKFNGKTLKVKTNANGYAVYKIPTSIKPKKAKYTITATFNGVTKTNKVKVNSIIKATNKKVKKSKKVTKVKVSLKKVNGKFLKAKTIKIKFKGKTYKVRTNKKGVATWKVKKSMLKKLKVGKKYKYSVTYGKDKVTKKLTIKK